MRTRITVEQMRRIDANAVGMGLPIHLMMENAGRNLAGHLNDVLNLKKKRRVVVISGTGNNGGGGLASARHLSCYGARVDAILLGNPERLTDPSRRHWKILQNAKSVNAHTIPDRTQLLGKKKLVLKADAIVDAIFGTGYEGRIREPAATAIALINESNAYKLSNDVPSGLDPNTGKVRDRAVRADATVALHRLKAGLNKNRFTGQIILANIGIPLEAERGVL
ncbi:MAG: NAD(P)H-hydrate epimerase [Nitrososphaerales archaeon]